MSTPKHAMETKRLTIDYAGRRVQLEYSWIRESEGGAPAIVFLHEGLGSVGAWKDFPQHLCEKAGLKGFAYSRFGYGKSTIRKNSEPLPLNYLHVEATQALPQLLSQQGIVKPWVIGHSDGATIALLAAAAFPALFSGLVVMAPHIYVEDLNLENLQKVRERFHGGALRQKLSRYHDDADSAFYGWNDTWLHPEFRDWNIEAEVKNVICPVLALQGDRDEYATLDQIYGIQRQAPQTQTMVISKCGHSPHRDQPDLVINAITEFIALNAKISEASVVTPDLP